MKPIFVIQLADNNQIDGDKFRLIVQEIENVLKEDYYVVVELSDLEVSKYHLFSIDGVTETTIEELKKLLSINEIKVNE